MGCNSTKMKVMSTIERNRSASRIKQTQITEFMCLLGCESQRTRGSIKTLPEEEQKLNDGKLARDYSHEPLFQIFQKHDTDNDGFLVQGEVKAALTEAGIPVVDEDLAFEWLDRNFENRLSYREFRRATEKARVVCPQCNYARGPADSSESDCEQADLLNTYWRKFDAERRCWVYANDVIDFLAKDWGIEVPEPQRIIEAKLMDADQDGKITYKKFKKYFTQVPEEDLKQRASSVGDNSSCYSRQRFEKHLDEMLLAT